MVRVPLRPGLGRHIRAGHPWVFRNALVQAPKIPAGSVVDLYGAHAVLKLYSAGLNAYRAIIVEALKAQVDLALVEERYQPPDHPIRLQFKEGRYLKFFVLKAV